LTVTPARGQAMIRAGVQAALAKRSALKPYRVQTPVNFEVGFKLTMDAERASYIPGLTRAGAHAIRGSLPDITQVVRLMQVLSSLELPE
jgi:D-aminopeptidase